MVGVSSHFWKADRVGRGLYRGSKVFSLQKSLLGLGPGFSCRDAEVIVGAQKPGWPHHILLIHQHLGGEGGRDS